MTRIAIDAYDFVGVQGGAGGAGTYLLSLIEALGRITDVRVIASPQNAAMFAPLQRRVSRLQVATGGEGHAEAVEIGVQDTDILYCPFTYVPDRKYYSDLPVVAAIHDLQHRIAPHHFPAFEHEERDTVYSKAASEADGILTFSESERQKICEHFHVRKPTKAVAHAPFLAEEISRRSLSDLPASRNPFRSQFGRYLFYPAVNWPHKNHYRLIEAFCHLTQRYRVHDLKLVLAGAHCVEPRTHHYKVLLDQPWAKERVIDLGFVSSLQLFLLVKGAEFLVFPSMYEGFGIPVLESLRLGTPVIASDLPALREWFGDCFERIQDSRNSLLMAEDIYRFLENPQKRVQLAAEGIERSAQFSSQRMARQTLDFFEEVIEAFPQRQAERSSHSDEKPLMPHIGRVGVIIHVLGNRLEEAALTSLVQHLAILREELPGQAVRVAVFLPTDDAGCSKRPMQQDNRQKLRSGRNKRLSPRVGSALSFDRLEAVKELAKTSDVNFFSPYPDGLSHAIHWYASTQVAAKFHLFVHADDLSTIISDADLIGRVLRFSTRNHRENVDGYYIGSYPWSPIRDRLIAAAHTAPWSLGSTTESDLVRPTQEFMLSDWCVRRSPRNFFKKAEIVKEIFSSRIEQPKPRFAYIETELRESAGHRAALAFGLAEAARSYGLEPIIGASTDAPTDRLPGSIVVSPTFSSYSQAPEEHVTPTNFAAELRRFLSEHDIAAADYVYVHMPVPIILAGILQVVATSREDELPVFLIRICSDDDSFRWHGIRQVRCLRAISEMTVERRKRIRVFVESLPLQRYFQKETGCTFPILLNPITRDLAFAGRHRKQYTGSGGVFTLGYFGEAREEKGFQLLPGIISRLLRRYNATIRFMIQTGSEPQNDSDVVRRARHDLESLEETHKDTGSIRLLDHMAEAGIYYEHLAQCDAILMPYSPWAYKNRGSGIALEAISLGRPIIVAANSDMATTFVGPACIVSSSYSVESFEEACVHVIDDYERICRDIDEYVRSSRLFLSEADSFNRLISDGCWTTTDSAADRRVAIWIGNNVLWEGCSSVYQAQRAFLRRQGFEIYNVYVPYPDSDGSLLSDSELEKHLVTNALGWDDFGHEFGCYSWMLNQADDRDRRSILEDIAEFGASTDYLLKLSGFNLCPPTLLRLIQNRRVDLVCVNYVHLLPIVEKLGLLGSRLTRVVLETHDIQAEQYAVRQGKNVDLDDRELEFSKLSDADGVVAISSADCATMRKSNPWANIEFVLPPTQMRELDWSEEAAFLTSEWLEVWGERDELRELFDLRTPDSMTRFLGWILILGRREFPTLPMHGGMNRRALLPHPGFPTDRDGAAVPNAIGLIWELCPDIESRWPNAMKPDHPDRASLLHWAMNGGMAAILPEGGLASAGVDVPRRGSPYLEAIVLAGPNRLLERGHRLFISEWLERHRSIDLLIVGSDHPANLRSIEWFLEEVYRPFLDPNGVSLVLAGRSGDALSALTTTLSHLLALGAVATLEPLYKIATVVVVPTMTGSGTPIKLLDALAHGLCVSAHRFVDRALGLSSYGFPLAATGSAFASDIAELLKSPEARQARISAARRFADKNLTIELYDEKWRQLAGLANGEEALGTTAPNSEQEHLDAYKLGA